MHAPWLEDRTLELRAEQLIIDVGPRSAAVDARFRFTDRAAERAHAMQFLVGSAGGPAWGFRAELMGENGGTTTLGARASEVPRSFVGEADEAWSFRTPESAFAGGSWLRVRYSQRATSRFDYVLRSGAYWAGPIHALDVVVRDPERRVAAASVEGRAPDRQQAGELRWHFADVEPAQPIRLTLRRSAHE
jgi:hypothetical protein